MNEQATTGNGSRRALVVGLVVVGLMATAGVTAWGVRRVADEPRGAALAAAPSLAIPPPRPITAGESYVQTRVLPSGDLLVTHWIESRRPLDRIRLSVPQVSGQRQVTADRLTVVADGAAVPAPVGVSVLAVTVTVPSARSVQVSYRLTGALDLSGASPSRALARPTSLTVDHVLASERIVRTIIGPRVLSLDCAPPAQSKPPVPCGTEVTDREWTTHLSGQRSLDQIYAVLDMGRGASATQRSSVRE